MDSPSPTEVRVGISVGRVVVTFGCGHEFSLDVAAARGMASDMLWGCDVIEYMGATAIDGAMPIIEAGGQSNGKARQERLG